MHPRKMTYLGAFNLVKTCFLTFILSWGRLSFTFQTIPICWTHIFQLYSTFKKCNIFVVFFNSPDASEKVDLMLFLWFARLVRIYSLTSFIKAWKANFAHFLSFPLGENVLIDLFWQNWRLLKAQSLKSWKSKLCSFCERTAWWKSTHWLLLTNLVAFESSEL